MKKQGYNSIDRQKYWNIHAWIRRNHGLADHCSNNCGTTASIFDWALIHGRNYEKKIENYKPLCKRCHHKYDERSTFGPLHPMFGKNHTEESRAKMRASSKHGKPNLGGVASEETRLKMSLARRGIPKSEEHKRKIGLAHKGRKMSEEQKKKLSLSRMGQFASEATKLKMSLKRKGIPWSVARRQRCTPIPLDDIA